MPKPKKGNNIIVVVMINDLPPLPPPRRHTRLPSPKPVGVGPPLDAANTNQIREHKTQVRETQHSVFFFKEATELRLSLPLKLTQGACRFCAGSGA